MTKNSMSLRIVILCLIILPLPFLINASILSYLSFQTTKNEIFEELKNVATEFNLKIEKTIYLNKLYLTRIADALGFHDDPIIKNPNGKHYLSPILLLSKDLMGLAVLSPEGLLISENEHDPFVEFLAHNDNLQKNIRNYSGSSLLITIPSDKENAVYILTVDTIEAAYQNRMSGYLLGFKKLNDLDVIPRDNPVNVVLIDQTGRSLIGSSYDLETESFLFKKAEQDQPFSFSINGTTYLGISNAKTPLSETAILAYLPQSQLIIKTLKIPLIFIVLSLISILLLLIFLIKISSRLNKPLNKLSESISAVSKGDYDLPFQPIRGGYEINRLGQIFNTALQQLLEAIEKAQQETVLKQQINKEIAIVTTIENELLHSEDCAITYPHFQMIPSPHPKEIRNVFLKPIKVEPNRIQGIVGLFSHRDLSSCLFSISIRSLFLTYLSIGTPLIQIRDLILDEMKRLGLSPLHFQSCLFELDLITNRFIFYNIGDIATVIHASGNDVFFLQEETVAIFTAQSKIFIIPDSFTKREEELRSSPTVQNLLTLINKDAPAYILIDLSH